MRLAALPPLLLLLLPLAAPLAIPRPAGRGSPGRAPRRICPTNPQQNETRHEIKAFQADANIWHALPYFPLSLSVDSGAPAPAPLPPQPRTAAAPHRKPAKLDTAPLRRADPPLPPRGGLQCLLRCLQLWLMLTLRLLPLLTLRSGRQAAGPRGEHRFESTQ
jgi:hypothetical protein